MEQAFLELIKSRRSIRSYRPDAIPKELLDAVLEAGTYAPSAMGRQSATIVAVTDKAVRDELMRLNAEVMGTQNDPYYGAPVIVLVLADGTIPTYIEDGQLCAGEFDAGGACCWTGQCLGQPRAADL